MSTTAIKAPIKEYRKKKEISPLMFKSLTTLFLSLVSLLIILLMPILQISKNVISINITGSQILSGLSFGSIFFAKQHGIRFEIKIPQYVTIFILAITILLAATIIITLIGLKKPKATKILGWLKVGIFAGMIVYYFFMMMSGAPKVSSPTDGKTTIFYESYQLGMGLLISSLLIGIAGWMELTVNEKCAPKLKRYMPVYLLIIIPVAVIFAMYIYPILLQTILAFKDYKLADGIWGSKWTGVNHFKTIFQDPVMKKVVGNTIYISLLRFVAGLVPPIIFAIVLFDLRLKRMKKGIQTIVYIPHFLSWVVIYAIVYAFLTPDGAVNKIIINIFGSAGVDFLSNDKLFLPIQIISSIWKELGWGTILYSAALSNVDTGLYEAAALDGAGPIQRNIHITLPSIAPVIVFLMIMSIGNVLKGAGGEQMLIFANSAVMEKATVIDTWVYWQGLGQMQYGLGAAVSFFQSVVGIVLVLFCNKFSRKVTGVGIW